ncbi:hypothetical protein GCM10009616_37530 [Microlunatus lacustris]
MASPMPPLPDRAGAVVTALLPADLPDVWTASPGLAPLAAAGPAPTGWVVRGERGALLGAVVDLPGRAADGPAGAWSASSPRVLADLYTVAAATWLADGITTHRVVLPCGDPLEPALVDLGFGHQQAFGSVLRAALDSAASTDVDVVDVRPATWTDLPALAAVVPLVARHQGASPVFAPRTPGFFEQLAGSLEEFVEAPDRAALLAVDGAQVVGFVLVEVDGPQVELVLAGTTAERRGRGVARRLVGAAAAWGATRGADRVVADWRTTNPAAAGLWRSVGLRVDAYRWARTIDPTPT